jgi:hypothetical protein
MKRYRSSSLRSFGLPARWTLLAAAVACSDGTAPVVVLPQQHVFGPCAQAWSPAAPPAKRTVVDFHFAGNGDEPTPKQVRSVLVAGGVVLHRFHVPILRAEIDIDAVPSLVGWPRDGIAHYAVTVLEPANREVELLVMLSRDLTDADIAAVEALGGRILSRWDALDGYAVDIDDAAVPRVRALPGVLSVSKNTFGCFFG